MPKKHYLLLTVATVKLSISFKICPYIIWKDTMTNLEENEHGIFVPTAL